MKRVNFAYNLGSVVKGTADNLYENEHNAAELYIVFDEKIDLDNCNFAVQFHTPDCRRPRYLADFDAETRTVRATLTNDVMCAGKVTFDLEKIVQNESGDVISVTHILSSDFTVKPAICEGEESSGEYTDTLRLLEQKYIKAKQELDYLISNVINNILPLSQQKLQDALDYTQEQTDLTIELTEQACATLRTELANELRKMTEDHLSEIKPITVTMGSLTMVDADRSPSVYNSGTSTDIILNFEIPHTSITVNGQEAVDGNIDLTYKDIPSPAYVTNTYSLDTVLPKGMITDENGGYLISLKGATTTYDGIKGARSTLVVFDSNGEIRDMLTLPELHKWDSAQIYKSGKLDVLSTDTGFTINRLSKTADLSKITHWSKQTVNGYTQFYTSDITGEAFDSSTESAPILSENLAVYSPGKPNPSNNEWMLSFNEKGYLTVTYGGEYSGTVYDFLSEITTKGSEIVYCDNVLICEYEPSTVLSIKSGDAISLLSEEGYQSVDGSISIAELPYIASDTLSIVKENESYTLSATIINACRIPEDNLSEYAYAVQPRNIICRGENIFPPMIERDGIFKNAELIPVFPEHKYYYRFFGASVADMDILIKEYDISNQLVASSVGKDLYFITNPQTHFVLFEINTTAVTNPISFKGVMSEHILNEYLPYLKTSMHFDAKSDGNKYKIKLINGGELVCVDGIDYTTELKRKKCRGLKTLSAPYGSGYFVPYGVTDDAISKLRVQGAESDGIQYESDVYFYHGGNQYNPYIQSSPVSDYEDRSFVEKLEDGWARAYNTDVDRLVIKDDEPTVLKPNTVYTLITEFADKSGSFLTDLSAVDDEGNDLKIVKMGNTTNGYRYTVITLDNSDVYFTFTFNPNESAVKSIKYRVSVNTGEDGFSYTPHRNPDTVHIDPIGADAVRNIELRGIHPTRGGWILVKNETVSGGKVDVFTEVEERLIACDVMEDTVSIYSRTKDIDGNTLYGLRKYTVLGFRNSTTTKSLQKSNHKGVIKLSEDVSYLGLSTSTQIGDVITVYGR